jgi:MHS family proline/betaine transporter-like MFS transporter
MGGVLTSSICFSIEHSDKKHQNFISSISMASICAGILLGSIVAFKTISSLSSDDFENWGWRIPFFLGAIVIFVGLYIKKYTSETPDFKEEAFKDETFLAPLTQTIMLYWKKMLISIGINATGSILFYLQAVYLANYLKLNSNFSIVVIDKISSISYACMIFFTLFAGWIADKFGNVRILRINLVVLLLAILPLLTTTYSDNIYQIMFVQICLGFLAATYISIEVAMQANFYPANIRSTALALSYNIATTIFGGATPYILENITQTTGYITSCSYYVIFFAFISLYSVFLYNKKQTNFTR